MQAYTGLWYQIAAIPAFYNYNCVRSIAFYTLNPDNTIEVNNTCYDLATRRSRSITGLAYVAHPSDPFSLVVTFPGIPVATEPNYIIYATDYITYSLVGSSDKQSLFILSRYKFLDHDIIDDLLELAEQLGYDTTRLAFEQW